MAAEKGIAKPRQPGAKEQRRRVIAQAVLDQKPVAAIAREIGISRELCSREINTPETQTLIQQFLAKHDTRLEKIVERTVSAVEEGLDALKDDPADHRIRLAAVERAHDLMELRQFGRRGGKPDAGSSSIAVAAISGDMGDILALYAQITRGA